MHYFFLVIVLSLHVGYSLKSSDSFSPKHGSHNLLKLEKSNNSLQRPVRCTPCETDLKRPISNDLDPEYRGNGADNLGYDWSPMAWGGPAYPRRSKDYVGGMRGRDGRMMMNAGGRNQGNVRVICDTCRTYWDGGRDGGGSGGRGRGRQYDMPGGGQEFYGGQPGYWQGGNMRPPGDYETRVMSPTVGVLVKPGSRIAYIPSRSGEMYWDGVSGGGTRWDGFSNGISWIGNSPAEWDRSDAEPRDGPGPVRPEGDYPSGPNSFGPWNTQKRPPSWDDNAGRGYYFTNGVPNDIDPQWRDRGYASNWHYGSTDQNGWNGNNMKWSYGGKQWADNDRAANRFYFNSPQDRTYGPSDGHRQYGNQYPNYQPTTGYPAGFRPQPSWPGGGSYRPNDRFPGGFQQGSYGHGDKDRPWDYTSRDPFGNRLPGSRPEWARPGPSYPGNFVGNYGKYSGPNEGYDKFSPSDKNDFDKPWNRPSGYGPSKPGQGGGFPYGGNRYPDDGSGGGVRPTYPGGGHLFYPNDGGSHPGYGIVGSGSGDIRPGYPGGNRKHGEYPGYGGFTGDSGRPLTEYPGDKRPIYTGGRPSGGYPSGGSSSGSYPGGGTSSGSYPGGGSSSGSYPGGGSSTGNYPGGASSSGSYPGGGSPSGSYPGGGSSSGSYPGGGSPSGSYPGGGSSSGSYPGGGRPSGGYPTGGSSSGSYPGGSSSGSYPGGSSSGSYPGGSSSGSYPGGGSSSGSYPGGGSSSGSYPSGGSSTGRYPSGGSSSGGYTVTEPSSGGYPSGGSLPGTYPGSRPSGYPSPSSGGGPYVGRPGGSYPAGGNRPGSLPAYFGVGDSSGGYPPDSGSTYPRPGAYPGGGGSYPSGSRPGLTPDSGYPNTGYFGGSRPSGYPGSGRPGGFGGDNRPGYPSRGPLPYPSAGGSGGPYQQGGKNPPKGYYTGFITELGPDEGHSQYGGTNPNYFGSSYPGDKNFYPGKDKYYNGGSYPNGYPSGDKNRYPAFSEDRYSSGGGGGGGGGSGGYPSGDNDRGRDKYYYGQSDGKGKYPNGYPSNHRYPSGGGDEFDRNQGSSSDKNSWNYGQSDHKEGIYRRSGGSYPPYRGGQYYTSSYLASMSTTAGSTQADQKTQSATKAEEVTQPTSDAS